MTVIVGDATTALMNERRACVDRIAAIDVELAEGAAAMRAALQPPAAAAAPASAPSTRTSTGRTHMAANRQAAGAIKHGQEVKTALVKGPLGVVAIVKGCRRLKRDDVVRTLKALRDAGAVVKIGDRGPHCKWALKGSTASRGATPARVTVATASGHSAIAPPVGRRPSEEFEVVWPPQNDPKAHPSAVIGARA